MDKLTILEKMLPLAETGDENDIAIDTSLCIGATKTRKNCSFCMDICPTKAISYSQTSPAPYIDRELCTNCGACATICPVCAIPLPWTHLEIQDAHHCLDGIDEAALLHLIANGQSEITLYKKECSTCNIGCKFDMPALIKEYVDTICATIGAQASIAIVESEECSVSAGERLSAGNSAGEQTKESDGATSELDRRGALSAAAEQGKGLAARLFAIIGEETLGKLDKTINSEVDDKSKQSFKETKIARILKRSELARAALKAIVQRENIDVSNKSVQSRLWGHPRIDPLKCTNCHLCVAYCPTSAIEKAFDGRSLIGYNISPHRCVQCGICLKVCRPKALKISQTVQLRVLLEADFDAQRYEQWDRIKQDVQEEKD